MISGRTKLFCIVADPIGHVRTPQMFNAHLEKCGIDAVLVPVHVTPDKLSEVVQGLRSVSNLRGIVVTVPHKISMLEFCDEFDASASIAGAVNILRRDASGRMTGANFDGVGFRQSLEDATGSIAGKSIYLAGAGGVARAIAFSLADAGIRHLSICNRSQNKAEELLAAVQKRFPDVGTSVADDRPELVDVAVNATSLGLKASDGLPFAIDRLKASAVVADVVMEPIMTKLLTAAEKKGHQIVRGDAMLKFQLQSWVEFIDNCPSLGPMPSVTIPQTNPASLVAPANQIGHAKVAGQR
ncbi:shikimate dehydrogenase [Bosea sp. (in: a-proteobacteria)]|uniref:shikimate dehydrogenase family protein n=1 Tax=Bosea sp. (in: a-proteobacteria) TaxID=1871050 RepID=UPI0025C0B73B|nr:shikimate dehydrogenase [Bosea sp. (in: a-proteobacteria)]